MDDGEGVGADVGWDDSEGANDNDGVDVGSDDNEGDDEDVDVVDGHPIPIRTPGTSDSKPPPSSTESLS